MVDSNKSSQKATTRPRQQMNIRRTATRHNRHAQLLQFSTSTKMQSVNRKRALEKQLMQQNPQSKTKKTKLSICGSGEQIQNLPPEINALGKRPSNCPIIQEKVKENLLNTKEMFKKIDKKKSYKKSRSSNEATEVDRITTTQYPIKNNNKERIFSTNKIVYHPGLLPKHLELMWKQANAVDLAFKLSSHRRRRGIVNSHIRFVDLRIVVESQTNKAFDDIALSRLIGLSGSTFWEVKYSLLKKSRLELDISARTTEKVKYELVVEYKSPQNQSKSNLDDAQKNQKETLASRQIIFLELLLKYVKCVHSQWLKSHINTSSNTKKKNPIQQNVVDDKITVPEYKWHKDFNLESVPLPNPAVMPGVPELGCRKPSQVLKKQKERILHRQFSANLSSDLIANEEKQVSKRLSKLNPSLIAKIRAKSLVSKQQEEHNVLLSRSIMMKALPRTADMLHGLFVSSQRSVLKKREIIDKLHWSYRSSESFTKKEIEHRLDLLLQKLPQWLSVSVTDTGTWIKVDDQKDYNEIRLLLRV